MQSKAQFQKPFPDSAASWKIYFSGSDGTNPYHGSFDYYIEGDTTLFGYTYNMLFVGLESQQSLIGLYRADSNKVYFRKRIESPNHLDTVEVLLYDFPLAIGDSILTHHPDFQEDSVYIKLVSIDTKPLQDKQS